MNICVILTSLYKNCRARTSFIIHWAMTALVAMIGNLQMATMKNYHDLYLKFNLDVFEKSRNRCLNNYGLCPIHFWAHQL